jgi:cytochrome c oxidase subunit II
MNGTEQSALNAAGSGARAAYDLLWSMTLPLTALYVVLAIVIVVAVVRGRRRDAVDPETGVARIDAKSERTLGRVVAGFGMFTAVVLTIFLVAGLTIGHAVVHLNDAPAVEIKLTGHQWWWEIEYKDTEASRTFTTANEMHIPVGQNVDIQLVAADVIHSFWVPSLAGKRDLIPGRNNHTMIRAERAGEYVGQCAEFCGLQHAHMRLLVVAEPADAFHAWADRQRQAAPPFTGEAEARGQQLFVNGPCAMCHQVRGTTAGGRGGPDLTHLASRRTIAAGTRPNTKEHLSVWILDSQAIKPGNKMPQITLNGSEIADLTAWLGTLR